MVTDVARSNPAGKIRVGIVGAGTWAEYGHIPSLKLLPEYEITAVYSRDPKKAVAVAERHGIQFALNSLKSLVEHPKVDSGLLPIFGGAFLDMLFTHFGTPASITGLLVNHFKEITSIETGVTQPHTSPDQVVLSGTLANGAVLSVHLEAGKRNNFGIQLDITGTEGDFKISNSTSFGEAFNKLEGARGSAEPLKEMPVPASYVWVPPSSLGGSAFELAHLYAAYARDKREGTSIAPTFRDGLKMHDVIEQIEISSRTGARVTLGEAGPR